MKKILLLLLLICVFASGTKADWLPAVPLGVKTTAPITDGFVTTWKTDAGNQTVVIPINTDYAAEYDYNVEWGDGSSSAHQTGNASHTYSTQGIYTVTITGAFPAIEMSNTLSTPGNNQRLVTVEKWGNGTWKSMAFAFRYCPNLTKVANENGPFFAPGCTLFGMFLECSRLNCDLNLWNLTNVTDIGQMFQGASAFNGDISDWDVSNVTNMSRLFDRALNFNGDISGWNVSNVTSMTGMFQNTPFNGDIGNWNVGKVTNMTSMFYLAPAFNQDINRWDVSNVTNMAFMFFNAPAFNQNLNSWNVSKVTNMAYMFQGATAFNGNIQSWDVSKVTDMSFMLSGAVDFNQDISGWDVGSVTSMMGMFDGLSLFNQNISGWNTSNLTQMDYMFNQASSFNQNIGNWDVSKVTSMKNLFEGAAAFNQNLGGWQVSLVSSMDKMLDGTALSDANYEGTLAGWAAQTVKTGVILGAAGLKYCSNTARQSLINNNGWQILNDRQACLVPAIPDGAGIVYVDSAVAVPGDGSSWANALKYLSNATESARTNTAIKEVHIAKGSYYPAGDKNIGFSDSAFVITRPGLKIVGGYSNGGNQYDSNLYPTVLSGDIGLPADTVDNTRNVLVINNIPNSPDSLILDGLTITGGNAILDIFHPDPENIRIAGGICISSAFANTVIRNCRITDNYGMACSAMSIAGSFDAYFDPSLRATPQIINCIFNNNKVTPMEGLFAPGIGSTLVTSQASPSIINCDFTDNRAIIGGVLSNSNGAPVLYNSRFLRDTALLLGTIYNTQNSGMVLINCSILDNVSYGTVLPTMGPDLSNTFRSAMLGNDIQSNISLINTTIANNKSLALPAVGRPLIANVRESFAFITNSIIWGNATNTILDSLASAPSKISYNLIQGRAADPANHILDGNSTESVFADTAAGNFQLTVTSAAINAGLNDSLINAIATYLPVVSGNGLDLVGNGRINDGAIDLGAYEFFSSSPLPVKLKHFSGTLNGGVASLTWESGNEENLNAYSIEKSLNGKIFQKLATVKPTGSNSHYSYKATQLDPTAYYRLKVIDMNGKLNYSSTIQLSQNVTQGLILYPNPAKNYIHIRLQNGNTMRIYNAAGVFIKAVSLKAGDNKIEISQFASGMYFGTIDGQKLQFVKQ
ncbi:BspA family leucine-rich repeat surface protein [Arachidicoccus terrestris]|uniref:BspA family leucine-rich repeat surface protein n=1 Tax=Arachidicoccus terrestris TaxID=2875539 RepID=UPI001CC4D787|nr:BspA family leucine-rich repeat surface protein [Arachidicoccus terrestris]UAY54032.1 BspA family leucine-rich repeat surface protein [Arachidicoccus terrestris]